MGLVENVELTRIGDVLYMEPKVRNIMDVKQEGQGEDWGKSNMDSMFGYADFEMSVSCQLEICSM